MLNKPPLLTWTNVLRGGLVYSTGDSAAAWLLDQFQWTRLLGMMLLGATLYAVEIPAYFRWLERRFGRRGFGGALRKALMAQAFFNPLWIARHLAFIKLFAGQGTEIGWHLLATAASSFAHLLPFGLLMNFLIQNRVPLNWRFFASALYSALTTLYFALGEVLFG